MWGGRTMIPKIICWFKRHKRGNTRYNGNKIWHIECQRCGFWIEYTSPCVRLVGKEMRFGFDGK